MKTFVYKVVADGSAVVRLRHVRSTGNGWHTYAMDDLFEFKSRQWHAHTDDLDAVLYFIMACAKDVAKFAGDVSRTRRLALQIENAAVLAGRIVSQRSRRLCGY